ncbi:MYXO-CTERM sorting domain-containing protein [Chondromyces crocatus]|uniref:Secreted protein n=1 Tax=Chondromyces crocatus TaxID=52 RepID=A0A0K1ER33_CHOCO|nr:MYXO-CTERM sorting domain-containing protein [Chondromyces crocatus]AKT43058.1 uncharacterized protein CMC5_072850 [Chondromyces crocatus]
MRSTRSLLVLSSVVSVALTLLGRDAHADAVMPPPDECPPGALPRTSHIGPYCQPSTCETGVDCPHLEPRLLPRKGFPLVCRERALCVTERIEPDGPPFREDDPGSVRRPIAVSSCDEATSCAAPARCETTKRCVPLELEKELESPASKGCGCGVVPAGEGAAAVVAGLVVSGWMVLRRRRAEG